MNWTKVACMYWWLLAIASSSVLAWLLLATHHPTSLAVIGMGGIAFLSIARLWRTRNIVQSR